jgi:YVTN family beta-propeller protein
MIVSNEKNTVVKVIDTVNFEVVRIIPIGSPGGAPGIAISSDGKFVYACNYADGTVSAIDTANNTVVATIPVGESPFSITLISK